MTSPRLLKRDFAVGATPAAGLTGRRAFSSSLSRGDVEPDGPPAGARLRV
jgi:hypothetical protein